MAVGDEDADLERSVKVSKWEGRVSIRTTPGKRTVP